MRRAWNPHPPRSAADPARRPRIPGFRASAASQWSSRPRSGPPSSGEAEVHAVVPKDIESAVFQDPAEARPVADLEPEHGADPQRGATAIGAASVVTGDRHAAADIGDDGIGVAGEAEQRVEAHRHAARGPEPAELAR